MSCICGHEEEDHKQGFLAKCTVPDDATEDGLCPCLDYEEDERDNDDE